MLGHVAASGDQTALALQGVASLCQHLGGEVDHAVACGLGPDQGPAPAQPLAGENAPELVREALVHAEEIADLPAAHADVAGRDVGVGSDVAEQLTHEALTEAHDLGVALALGVEVGPSLAPAHGQGGEGVLEDLLESQELEDAQIDRRVEAQAALVGADGRVHLHAEATLHLDLALVVHPGYPEHDDALRLDQALHDLGPPVLGVAIDDDGDGVDHFADGLVELRLGRVPGLHQGYDLFGVAVQSRLPLVACLFPPPLIRRRHVP